MLAPNLSQSGLSPALLPLRSRRFFFFFDTARSIPTAIAAGATLAVTSALIDSGGQTTRVDNGREYYPYTPVEKRAQAES
ncbi:hypothetical protein DY000_02028517 [Brassica cretica]|uniref:Uncharacterized protein n=1 Tax=Brassica cretica TaxID=69181 RepID=A0ABQ7DGW3_BRACR|nr:hypothetical protein DY000_02028517 [Brassica cretica]